MSSDGYTGIHRSASAKRPRRFSRRLVDVTIGLLVGTLVGGGAAVALSAGDTIGCQPGQVIILDPSGTWACSDRPAPAPSATLSPSPSPSPSATTPSPSPTVSPTATTAPATSPPAPSPSPSVTPSPTPTPTPSPSPTGLLRNCFGDLKNSQGPIDQSRLAACGYPTLASTGVPPSITPTAYQGPMTITTATTVIDGKRIPCGLNIRAANVTIRNSLLIGPAFYCINMDGGTLTITDSELNCTDAHGTGIAWANFWATRVYIHDCENALEIGANSWVIDSYLSSREASGGHADDIQSQGGSDVLIRHNTFAGLNPITSSIISNPDRNSRWTVEANFFSAGAYTVYCPENVAGGWVVRNNRFYGPTGNYGSDPHRPAYGYTDACGGVGTWVGNFRDDTLGVVNR